MMMLSEYYNFNSNSLDNNYNYEFLINYLLINVFYKINYMY